MSADISEYIIRFAGDIAKAAYEEEFTYTALLGNFAVINIERTRVEGLISRNDILYAEPSRKIYYDAVNEEYSASCMNIRSDISGDFLMADTGLTGRSVITAVIDSGVDLLHTAFSSTEVIEIWDQTAVGEPPIGYDFGAVSKERSNTDNTGHGTSVAGIIAECVPDSPLLIVKLRGETSQSSSTAALIQAIDYCIRKSIALSMPMVINLSYGNNYGNHAGDAIVEEYIDQNAESAKLTIVAGMGNEGEAKRHAQLMFGNIAWEKLEILANPFLAGFTIQIWKLDADIIDIFIRNPEGNEIGPLNEKTDALTSIINDNIINISTAGATPYNPYQETFISITPVNQYVSEGIWTLKFRPRIIKNGRVDLWLPVSAATSSEVFFITPSVYTTMTIPSTASKVISVGAYNSKTLAYAVFSGRGFSLDEAVKPDLTAPGVNISVPIPGNLYGYKSGTSFSTPFVSAGAAMLMQWGITEGNDPFMYGQKVKLALAKGAKKLPGYTDYPNEYVGYGALCVRDSIP